MRIQRYDSLDLRDFRSPYDAMHARNVQEAPAEYVEPPAPTYSQSELEAAKQIAHKAGFEEGKNAGVESVVNETHRRDTDASEAMHKLATDIKGLQQQYQDILAKQGSELTELVTLIARKVAGDALDANASKMIEGMVIRCLPIIVYKPRVIIDVHPEILDKVQAHLNTLLREAGFTGDLTVRAGSTIARNDVKIDWAAGYAERSTEALWSEVTTLLSEIALRTHDEPTNEQTS